MILEEIRPLLVGALIGLVALSVLRSRIQSGPVRIPVRFEERGLPQRIVVRRFGSGTE
jgi:hypothetical protein